ncbi:GNAT family N-acetyltransferase [Planococcus antarcticus]|nr:GNAT family N-acetyltransferase [Planococcus antarcticus]
MDKESILNGDMNLLFESERCCVRHFINADIDDFLLYRNNPKWMKFQGFKGLLREEYEEILLKEPLVESGAQFAVISKADHSLVGDIFIKKVTDTFWIGYTVSPLVKRQGYAYEIANSMILWIKQQGEYKIKAGVALENKSSIRLLEKLGFLQLAEENGELIYLLPQDK